MYATYLRLKSENMLNTLHIAVASKLQTNKKTNISRINVVMLYILNKQLDSSAICWQRASQEK